MTSSTKLSTKLSSVLLASTVLLGGTLTYNSAEARGNNAWMIKKVSKATTPYCAMIKRYSGDRVLSFAQRDASKISTAIDFGDNFLDKGRAYSLTLSDGDGFSRRFEVKPASSSAVVIKLNSRDPLLGKLADKGALNVNIAGISSNFNIDDLASGLEKLDECHAKKDMRTADASMAEKLANITPAAGDEVSGNPISKKTSSHSLYSTAANSKIQQLEQANDKLKASIKDAETKLSALENQLRATENNAKLSTEQKTGEISTLQQTMSMQTAEINDLKSQLTNLQTFEGKNQNLQNEISTLNASNAQLAGELAAIKANAAASNEKLSAYGDMQVQFQNLQTSLISAEQEKAILQQNLASLKQSMAGMSTAQGQAQQMQTALAQKDTQIQNLNNALKMAESSIRSMEQNLAAAQAQIKPASGAQEISPEQLSTLESQLKASEMEKKQLQAEMSKIQRMIDTDNSDLKISRLEKALNETNRALDKAGKENAALYQDFIQIEKQLETAKLEHKGGNWDVKKANARFDEAQREIRRLAMHIEENKKQCAADKQKMEAALFNPKITAKKQQAELTKLENKMLQLSKSQQACQQQLASLENASQKVAMAKPAVQNDSAANQVAAIQPAAGTMPAIDQLPKKQKIDRSMSVVNVLQGANIKLNQELNEYKSGIEMANASFDQGYSWKSGHITGSFERFEIGEGTLKGWSDNYSKKLANLCSGDFAVMPSKKSTQQVIAYDVACVNGDFGTTESVIITGNAEYLEVYKLSGNIQDMTALMDSREQISVSVGKSL